MTVLVQGVSVIIKVKAIDRKFPGGLELFSQTLDAAIFCTDCTLAAVSFLKREEAIAFVEYLESYGIESIRNGKAVEAVIVDQFGGPDNEVDWLEYGRLEIAPGKKIGNCAEPGALHEILVVPEKWDFDVSISAVYKNPEETDFSNRANVFDISSWRR